MYKTILVHVDNTQAAGERIDAAARLALLNHAHLVGAAMTGLSPYVFPVGGFEAGLPSVEFPVDELRAVADRALDAFEERVRPFGLASVERRRVEDEAGAGMSMMARYCDLVVIGQTGAAPQMRADFAEYVLLNCARPVLILPPARIATDIGRRVTLAWNGSADATRALTSAIPLMQRADKVELVMLDADTEGGHNGERPAADIRQYLARHGITAALRQAEGGRHPGEALLACAGTAGSDLIVMGAYGHSRFREILMGGATRTALRTSTLPLWMAH